MFKKMVLVGRLSARCQFGPNPGYRGLSERSQQMADHYKHF